MNQHIKAALAAYITLRIAASVWAVVLLATFPFVVEPDSQVANDLAVAAPHDGVLSEWLIQPWFRWDTLSYTTIAHAGYGDIERGLTAFLPVYPALIALLGRLLCGEYLLAALIISNVSAVAAFALLHRLVTRQHGVETAHRTLAYLVLFPTSFFFVAAYTESLFLLLVLLCFDATNRRRWLRAGVWGVLAIFTRWQGVALVPALGIMVWRHRRVSAAFWRSAAGLSIIPVAGAGGLLAMRATLGARALPWNGYQDTWHSAFVWPGAALGRSALAAMGVLSTGGDPAAIVICNVVAAAVFYALLLAFIRRHALWYTGVFGLTAHTITVSRVVYGTVLQSTMRYVLVLFPAFVVLAQIGERRAWLHRVYVYTSAALWLVFCALFVLWRWVA